MATPVASGGHVEAGPTQGVVEVGLDVVDVLDAHRHADQVGVTPALFCSASLSCWWVVLAGWMTRVLASPTLARWLASLTLEMNFGLRWRHP
jgi:hypothetical protein